MGVKPSAVAAERVHQKKFCCKRMRRHARFTQLRHSFFQRSTNIDRLSVRIRGWRVCRNRFLALDIRPCVEIDAVAARISNHLGFHEFLLESLGFIVSGERVHDGTELAFHHLI